MHCTRGLFVSIGGATVKPSFVGEPRSGHRSDWRFRSEAGGQPSVATAGAEQRSSLKRRGCEQWRCVGRSLPSARRPSECATAGSFGVCRGRGALRSAESNDPNDISTTWPLKHSLQANRDTPEQPAVPGQRSKPGLPCLTTNGTGSLASECVAPLSGRGGDWRRATTPVRVMASYTMPQAKRCRFGMATSRAWQERRFARDRCSGGAGNGPDRMAFVCPRPIGGRAPHGDGAGPRFRFVAVGIGGAGTYGRDEAVAVICGEVLWACTR